MSMQQWFGPVLYCVCAVGLIGAFVGLVSTGKTWEEYGKHRLLMDNDLPGTPAPGSAAALLERDVEVREMLEARNARRQRRGEAPLDVEQELKRLTATQIDDGLRGEIRELVIARNHRRARAGKPLLDVEAEIEREIASLATL
jgi:hypothetical protein